MALRSAKTALFLLALCTLPSSARTSPSNGLRPRQTANAPAPTSGTGTSTTSFIDEQIAPTTDTADPEPSATWSFPSFTPMAPTGSAEFSSPTYTKETTIGGRLNSKVNRPILAVIVIISLFVIFNIAFLIHRWHRRTQSYRDNKLRFISNPISRDPHNSWYNATSGSSADLHDGAAVKPAGDKGSSKPSWRRSLWKSTTGTTTQGRTAVGSWEMKEPPESGKTDGKPSDFELPSLESGGDLGMLGPRQEEARTTEQSTIRSYQISDDPFAGRI